MPVKKRDKYQVNENKRWFQKWWPKNVPKNISLPVITINEMLDEQVKKYANKNFIWFLETWMTYREFQSKVKSFATALSYLGIKKGDVVAIHLPNCFQYVISYYSITRIGAIATGINPAYQPIEILHQMDITKPKLLITLDVLYIPYIKPIIAKSSIEKVIYTHISDLARGPNIVKIVKKFLKKIPTGKVDFPGAINFMELLHTSPDVPQVKIDPKINPVTYIMTGGITGLPKAAVLTHFNVVSNATQCAYWSGGEAPSIGVVGVLPLFHSIAHTILMNTCVKLGGWMMLFPKPPDAASLLSYIEKIPAPEGLVYPGAEILFKRLAEYEHIIKYSFALEKLKLNVSAAGPLHKIVRETFIKKTGGRILEGYGLTEASPMVSAGNSFGESPIGVIGMPLPATEWGIWPVDDFSQGPICLGNPEDTNFGEEHIGELCIHGPQVMLEYLEKPEETSNIIKEYNEKLWLLTGDIGFMNEDGTVELRDRKKLIIRYKEYSVYPKEVEELLMKHPEILDVAVAGLPHNEFGEVVKAWIELSPGSTLTPEEIKEWTAENMNFYKRPYYVEIISEIPKNLIGEVERRILQEADPIWQEKYKKA